MKDIITEISSYFPYKITLSSKVQKNAPYKKLILLKKTLKNKVCYHVEKYTDTQVFHENILPESLHDFLCSQMKINFNELHAWTEEKEFQVRITKKGSVLFHKKNNTNHTPSNETHNRKKNYILEEGVVVDAFVDLGIMTVDGKIIHSKYDKFKQINRFIELVDDSLKSYKKDHIRIVDFGCGKSYLTFILYYYFTEIKKMKVTITGLDLKESVIHDCTLIAQKYGYSNLHFQLGNIKDYDMNHSVDMVISLHACDTATDYALFHAISNKASIILSVPCCQHELNQQIHSEKFSILTEYGIIKERFCSLMTDSIRANLLTFAGYETQLIEFVDFEHSPKNILIRAIKSHINTEKKDQCLLETETLLKEFQLSQTLYNLLIQK